MRFHFSPFVFVNAIITLSILLPSAANFITSPTGRLIPRSILSVHRIDKLGIFEITPSFHLLSHERKFHNLSLHSLTSNTVKQISTSATFIRSGNNFRVAHTRHNVILAVWGPALSLIPIDLKLYPGVFVNTLFDSDHDTEGIFEISRQPNSNQTKASPSPSNTGKTKLKQQTKSPSMRPKRPKPSTSPSRRPQRPKPSTSPSRRPQRPKPSKSPSHRSQRPKPSTSPSRRPQRPKPSKSPSRQSQRPKPSTSPSRRPQRPRLSKSPSRRPQRPKPSKSPSHRSQRPKPSTSPSRRPQRPKPSKSPSHRPQRPKPSTFPSHRPQRPKLSKSPSHRPQRPNPSSSSSSRPRKQKSPSSPSHQPQNPKPSTTPSSRPRKPKPSKSSDSQLDKDRKPSPSQQSMVPNSPKQSKKGEISNNGNNANKTISPSSSNKPLKSNGNNGNSNLKKTTSPSPSIKPSKPHGNNENKNPKKTSRPSPSTKPINPNGNNGNNQNKHKKTKSPSPSAKTSQNPSNNKKNTPMESQLPTSSSSNDPDNNVNKPPTASKSIKPSKVGKNPRKTPRPSKSSFPSPISTRTSKTSPPRTTSKSSSPSPTPKRTSKNSPPPISSKSSSPSPIPKRTSKNSPPPITSKSSSPSPIAKRTSNNSPSPTNSPSPNPSKTLNVSPAPPEPSKCKTVKNIRFSASYSTDLCRRFGSDKMLTEAAIQASVQIASEPYEKLCITLSIVSIDGFCPPTPEKSDVYSQLERVPLLDNGTSKDIIRNFRSINYERLSKNEQLRNKIDASYYFAGFLDETFPGGSAYVGRICDGWQGHSTGWIQGLYPKVLAHEVGHSIGIGHDSNGLMKTGDWLKNSLEFSEKSAKDLKEKLTENASCLKEMKAPKPNPVRVKGENEKHANCGAGMEKNKQGFTCLESVVGQMVDKKLNVVVGQSFDRFFVTLAINDEIGSGWGYELSKYVILITPSRKIYTRHDVESNKKSVEHKLKEGSHYKTSDVIRISASEMNVPEGKNGCCDEMLSVYVIVDISSVTGGRESAFGYFNWRMKCGECHVGKLVPMGLSNDCPYCQ